MKHNYFKSNQCEEMARNLWVYLYTQMGVKSAKSMSAGSEAEGRVTEGRASNEHPLSIHSASIEHPLQVQGKSVKMPLRFLRYVAMIFAVLVMSIANIGTAWADAASWKNNTMSPASYFALGTNTSAATNAQTIGGTSYTHSINMTSKSGQSSNNTNGYFIRFTLTSASNVSVLFMANGGARTIRVCTGWSYDTSTNSTQLANGATPTDGVMGTSASVANGSSGTLSVSNLAAGTYYICGSGSVSIFEITIATSSNWYLKGSFDSWGDGYNMAGSGTVSVKRTLNANTKYEFKLMDGTNWYGNGHKFGGTETNTVSTNTGNCYLMTSEAGSYKFDYNTSTNALTITYPNSYTYYYANSNTWSKVYVYKYTTASSITGENAAWPGVEIASPSYSCGGTDYYEATSDGYAKLIFTNNDGSQTGNMTVASADDGKYVGGTGNSWSALPTYTISYNNGGGTGSMSSQSSIACGTDKTTTSNTFTAPSGYQFAGWVANVDVKVGGSTKTAGTVLDDGVTIQEVGSNITLTAQWEERSCPVSGTVYSLTMKSATLSGVTQNTEVALATTYATDDGGTSYLGNLNATAGKAQISTDGSGTVYFNGNDAYIKIVLDCPIQTGDELTFTNGSGSRQVCITTSTTRATTYTTSSNSYTFPAAFNNASTIYVWRSESSGTYLHSLTITRTASCGATQPGEIGKGSLSNCSITLTAANSPAANNTWYWQSASDGTATNLGSGATKSVSTPGTYYIRSYFSTGSCWSDARSVTVTEGDLTPAAPTALAKSSVTAKGVTLTVTDAANTNDYEFYVSTNSTAPTSGTSASYTSTSKSITITDKYAGTTFYAWARAKCGSYKSGWTALTGNTFTTSTVTVTHTLTNVSKTSGGTTAGGSDYTAVYEAVSGYSMPTPVVTIDGNTATSGTDYTWTAGTGTITIPANKINGNIVITLNSVPSAPSSAVISGTYHYFPGENISLTCTPSGNNGPTTYQWYKGGKENGNAIEGATSATYTKNSCTFDDAGSYYCKVTCNATSIWAVTNSHENYDVKILRLYVKGSKGGQDYGNVDFVKVNSTTATASISLGSNWTYGFNIADGCGHYYGNSGTMQYNSYGPWVTNQNGVDCGLTTTNAATYVFTINYSNLEMIETTVTFPSGNQTSGKVIYFDNNDLQWENVYYRIGKSNHVQSAAMTKVYGTANLYQYTTPTYDNFAGWHITNAAGTTGSYSVYNTKNGTAITAATAFEGAAVTQAAVTVTPTASHATGATDENNNCEFYTYGITTGMKTQNVAITAPSNGTITVAYTDVNNAAQSFTSGNRDLAHTCIITVTAVPSTGYAEPATVSINGASHGNRDPYTITGTTVVAATFTAKTYNITLDRNGASSGSESVTMTYNSSSHTAITAPVKAGYTFDGWYDSETDNNGSGNLVMNASGVLQENVTGYTGAGGIWTKDATCTLYAKWTAVPASALITYNLKINTSGTTLKNSVSTTDETNITNIDIDQTNSGANGDGTTNRTTKLAIKTGANGADWSGTPTNYVLFKFKVACGKKLTPSKIRMKVANVGGASANNIKYKAVMSDNFGHSLTGTYVVATQDGTVETFDIDNADASKYFQGEVTLKLWAWTIASKDNGGSAFRMGTPLEIFGEVGAQATPSATITWNTQPANGQVGDSDFAYDVTCSDGSAVTVTSANTTYATIVGGKLHYAAAGTTHLVASATDACGNEVVQNSSDFTVSAAAPAGDCDELAVITATSSSALTATVGSVTYGSMTGGDGISIDGYSYSVKFNSSGHVDISPKAGETFAAGDSLIVVIYNHGSNAQTIGFKIGSNDYTASTAAHALHYFRQTLVAANISDGKVIINRSATNGSSGYIVAATIKRCGLLPSCTTPILPTLTAKTVCEGGDADAAWNAAITNSGSLVSGETVAYSWVKKGGSTPVSSVATYQPTDVTEAMAGTYVVTATVSADGKASKSASQEVDLTVTEGTEAPTVTQSTTPVYEGNSVTLTATATTGATYTWHTCNADGTGESSAISGATTNAYTIAGAPAAGTHYYKVKVTGDGTHTCGNAETVYALTVSEAAGGDCETEIWVVKAADLPEGATAATHITTPFTGGSNESASITIDGNTYTITQRTSNATGPATIVVPEGNTATLYILVKGNNGRSVILEKGGVEQWTETPENGWQALSVDNLAAGTYSLRSSNNLGWGLLALKLCSASACTDPEVTASANNTTACAGTSVTFTATGAHAEANYQWQKLDGTWTNISGATESTYNIPSVVAGDAGKYRVIASNDCNRTSNEVTLSVPTLPDFGSTVPASVSVMQTLALSISTVEATDAVKYRWYKSADATWDAGDVEIGTNKELIKAYDSEAIGSPSYYIFCRAQNACGITTSTAIEVNVTAYVEEECAIRGNEGSADFGFENTGMSSGTYDSKNVWYKNSNSNYLTYTAPEGKYLATAKVTIASSNSSNASYQYSTDNGANWSSDVTISGLTTSLAEKTINLPANVTDFRIGRNLDGAGESSGTFYLHKACFTYNNACTSTTVTPSTSSVNYEMGGAWSNPTFTLSVAGTLTYSSSNEDIASVDDDGTVTFNGDAGTVTITASYAGGTISATDYCASSGSYTINVSCTGGAPKVVADGSVDMSGCNSSVTLHAKTQSDGDFADGTYQWFRNGEEIDGATSSSYTATQAGTYTVERTNASDCTTPSTNSAVVTSETTEPEVERLVPFQYYHVDKTYSDQMKMRHLFAVKNSGKLDGKSFKMYVSRNGGVATDVTSSNALVVWPNGDGHVDTVMVDLNKLSGKYEEDDELVFTCKAIDCTPAVSETYKATITMHVIDTDTATLALICSGTSKAEGTRKTGELTVGGDFLTGYNVADLCQQTGNTSFDGNTEWGLYTDLKTQYIVTPVNGYAVFNKLNYEPFDILLLTDYPKASKSDAAADVLDDMAALCDYRPMLSFKTHMVAKSPSKWAEKGFTTSPVVTKAAGKLNLNIVCYAHPMFEGLKSGEDVYEDVNNTSAPLVYTMLTGEGYESGKGMQGFELAAAENFVTIGLTHYNANITKDSPETGDVSWTPGTEDRMLVTVAERQTNIEARFILFSLNCGAQSKLTDRGEQVILACLEYLLDDDPLHVADCSFTFDNGASNEHDAAWYSDHCNTCTGTKGDGKWTTAANWGPDYRLLPGEFTSVRIKAPVEVNDEHAHVMEVRIIDEGRIDIPAGKALDVKSTIRRMDGTEIYPTEESDIHIGSASTGNGTLIFNNDEGDTKARVDMYSNAPADVENMSAATSTWQYIGTPHTDVANARSNYYGSWLYQYVGGTWTVIPNGGPLVAFRGYCITNETAPVVYDMAGTLAATTTQDIAIPAGYTVIANSWTAPIDISTFTDDDMENISDKTIYFFNTGTDADGNHGTGTEAGTYVAVPKNSASYLGTWQIPSMQGFYISTETAGTLHLDYERHVRPHSARTVVGNQMYAPKRATAESDEPNVLKIFARGSRYQDKLVVLEREDFTRGYDSGWDGEAWGGGTLSPMVYVIGEGREDAVSAIPEFEGTVIAFKAGEDSEYRFEFVYSEDAEPLYLLDTENNTYTQVITGNAYYFTTTDKAAHSRFILTRKAPQIATGTELTSDGEGAKARKLLIEDKMYILLNGMLYDATGKVVK